MIATPASPAHSDRFHRLAQAGLPLAALILYGFLALAGNHRDLVWEESRYLYQAWLLTQGTFTEPGDTDILNGPGYPLVLAPAVILGAPIALLRLLNAVFMALAVWFTYRATLPYAGSRWSAAVAAVLLLHPIFLVVGPLLMTEAFALACLAAFAWSFTTWLREAAPPRWVSWVAVASLTALGLTRVVFGPVLEVLTVIALLAWLLQRRWRKPMGRSLRVLVPALLLCLPWLAYTQSVTGRTHSWSTVSWPMLYWSTAPGPQRGDYVYPEDWRTRADLQPVHRGFLESLTGLAPTERDQRYREQVLANVANDPLTVTRNWLHNLSRLAFGYPRPLREQRIASVPLFVVNTPLVLLLVAAVTLALRRWRSVPPEVAMLGLFALVYLAGHSVLPALARYGIIAWPLLGLLVADTLHRHVSLAIRD